MSGWEISLGVYTGALIGVCTESYEDGYKHSLYLPFLFIELNIYYD
tara:strand:- start:63 stop:200 length:138 start_codon:yes stop_codon:yes gene_type:complete